MKDTLVSPLRSVFDRFRNIPAVHNRLLYWAHGPEFRDWCRANPCPEVPDRYELYRTLLEQQGLDGPIDYLEFGVYQGESLRWWVENNRQPESRFFGFDSFEGLPESWGKMPSGTFTARGVPPDIQDSRCHFVKGLFQDTLPAWASAYDPSRRIVLHVDVDLYTSTLVILMQLLPKLKPSDIIVFDEFNSYMDEYLAFRQSVAAYYRELIPLAHAGKWTHVAFKLA